MDAVTLQRQLRLHHTGRNMQIFWQKTDERERKDVELENSIFIMTIGKLHLCCLRFSFVNENKQGNE